ncbi:MAG: hypothetical protein J0L84_10670, partial [Verrucomicrobia bacterium]|nr:hypothetical protein [Verrucomicrobiota bacterium]
DGSRWSALGDGLFATGGGTVQALAYLGDQLLAGGAFNQPVPFLARWDGAVWSSLGEAPDATVLALSVSEGQAIAGGFFTRMGGVAARHVARWDGVAWQSLGEGLGGDSALDYVATLHASGAGVLAGGVFTNAGSVAVQRIARFDGDQWAPLGSGMTAGPLGGDPFVYGLGVADGVLWVGGTFTEAGGLPAGNISTWTFEAVPTRPTLSVRIVASGDLMLEWSAAAGTRLQLVTAPTLNDTFLPMGQPVLADGSVQQTVLAAPPKSPLWYRMDVVE